MSNVPATRLPSLLIASLWLSSCADTGEQTSYGDGGADIGAVDCFDKLPEGTGQMLWPGFCTKDIDTDVDGHTDAQWIYEYDNDGNAIHLTVGPSISGYQYRWEYDSAGNQIVEEFDDGQDGTLDSITTRSYNDLGELISQELDEDGDGSVDVRDQYCYDCFPSERSVPAPEPCVISTDRDADGSVDRIAERTYDSDHNLLTEIVQESPSGEITSIRTLVYDDGLQTSEELDIDGNGSVDSRLLFSYNDSGQLTREEYDDTADGSIEAEVRFEYDVDGLLSREDHVDHDSGGTQFSVVYEYDADGRIVRLEVIDEIEPGASSIELRRYDSAGNLLAESFDVDTDGAIDACHRYGYECWQ